MPYIENSLKKFNNLPPELTLTVDGDDIGAKVKQLNAKYGVNFGVVLVFITVGDLSIEDIPEYLQVEFGLDEVSSKKAFAEFQKNIITPLKKRLDFLNANPNKQISLKDEKKIVLEIFKNNLIKELKNHPIIINAVNARIFYVLANDLNFKNKLESALYQNGELLTHQPFKINKTLQSPTIGNWIQDFIHEKGSKIFDNLILTDYMVTSPNASILSNEEKTLLKKVLITYRNIKFFPESMPSDDGEGWEIIPIEHNISTLDKARSVSGPPKTEQEKEIEKILKEEKKYKETDLEKKVLDEEIKKRKRIEDLEIMAKKYKDGTLEKQAILEEIKKLKN